MYSFLFMFYSNYCYSLHYLQDTVTTGLKMLTPTYHNLIWCPRYGWYRWNFGNDLASAETRRMGLQCGLDSL